MHTTYHFSSAQDITNEMIDSIKAKFKLKPITIIVEEDEIELTDEMKSMLDERLNEDEATYLSAKESIDRLNEKYGL